MVSNHYPDTTTFPRVRDVPAAVTERQRISKAVRGLPTVSRDVDLALNDLTPTWLVDLDAVLKIIDGQP